jgi:cyclomaltodextrinase
VIYSVFLRNHFSGTTLSALAEDLPRIRELGIEWLWLLPFYPVGEKDKKGSLGSPYSIRDYRAIDPALGSLQDFTQLIERARHVGLRTMIDIVFHHTAPDHPWTGSNPDYYWKNALGKMEPRISEWSDVVDLDLNHPELRRELIETLAFWAQVGVEGFRCDVAPLVPMTFWKEARSTLEKRGYSVKWLSESLGRNFIHECHERGIPAHSDEEVAEVFDWGYDYFHHAAWLGALESAEGIKTYIEELNGELKKPHLAEKKIRFVENHDQPRIRERLAAFGGEESARAWELFMALLPGEFLIYAGQEFSSKHQPSLFEIDPCRIDAKSEWINQVLKFRRAWRAKGSVEAISWTPQGVLLRRTDGEVLIFPLRAERHLGLPQL